MPVLVGVCCLYCACVLFFVSLDNKISCNMLLDRLLILLICCMLLLSALLVSPIERSCCVLISCRCSVTVSFSNNCRKVGLVGD